MKRSYAEVATAPGHPPAAPPPASTNAVRAQIQQVDALLAEAAPAPAPPLVAPPAATTEASVKHMKDVKKQLEDSIAALPSLAEFEPARAAFQAQLDGVVARIRSAAPPGARLDSARAALDRARGRKAAAAEALSKAHAALEAADAECIQLAKDVEALKAEMAPAAAAPPCTSSQLQRLEEAATDMLSELATAEGADPAHVKVATELSQQLVKGFQESLAQARAAARAAELNQPRRIVGKQPLPEPSSAQMAIDQPVPTRLNGQQAKMVTLQDFWPGASRKVLKSAVGKKCSA